ncbi:DUF1905 domain-containing protein [Chloroflexota bacterium]
MKREVKIDRAIYLADNDSRTYTFLKRNLDWKNLDHVENEENKQSVNGYTRVFRDGTTKVFRFWKANRKEVTKKIIIPHTRFYQVNMTDEQHFPVSGEVQIFQVVNPWVYVSVPKEYTEMTRDLANRGLVPITVKLGKSVWNTSLMPMGDGTHFIPLNANVRETEKISVGDHVRLSFTLRK